MLKKIIFTIFILLNFAQLTFAENLEIRFCESVLPYNGGLLISNFGSKDLQVKPNEQNGYVLYYKNNQLKEFIPKNGTLKTPTAMAVYKNKFYIADGDKIFIYDLKNMSKKPDKLYLMNGAKVVNDIIIDKGMLYATITDKNCVYKVDLKSKNLTPKKWLKIPSPNGIVAYKNTIYIASIPADYTNVRDENVIYVVPNKNNPKLERFNEKSGLYDGLGISKNGKFLYASDW
ncbi:MAG: hypothetical protein Q4E87_00645, partial [bacterium]|nr:hypothetical protein [bacterium]